MRSSVLKINSLWQVLPQRVSSSFNNGNQLNFKFDVIHRTYCDEVDRNRFQTKEEIIQQLQKEAQDYPTHGRAVFKYPSLFERKHEKITKKDISYVLNEVKADQLFRPFAHEQSKLITDILIIGGGVVGSSVAYAFKSKARQSFEIMVLERDPKYLHASSAISIGGIQQQFSLKENIEMAKYGAEFIRNGRRHLNVFGDEPLDLNYQPQGHLYLSDLNGANQLLEDVKQTQECGQHVELLDKLQLRDQFPWLNCHDDIAAGAFGTESEGWFDPFTFLMALKNKAQFLGANYMDAELIDFNLHTNFSTGTSKDRLEHANHAVVRTMDGKIKQIEFSRLVIAAGPENAEIAAMLRLGEASGIRSMPIPFKKRKRYYYAFECLDAPGLDFPLLVDPSGVFVRRDGLGGRFVAGKHPSEDEEIDNNNSDVDYRYFENRIAPVLIRRVPSFSNLRLLRGWAAFEDVNTFDQQPVIGRHPYYHNVFFAAGLAVHSVQMAPAVGRALQELMLITKYQTINLDRFGWDRIYADKKLEDKRFNSR